VFLWCNNMRNTLAFPLWQEEKGQLCKYQTMDLENFTRMGSKTLDPSGERNLD